ncbi:MAG: glycosyltransferase [Eubacteriales bacterium]|nr:glycosyltransferase [Eubacteriales bacterium]
MSKIAIIGHFGFGQNLLNGQTIKTKVITAGIEKRFGKENLLLFDLAGGGKRIPGLLVTLPKAFRTCENIVMLPGENGLRFLIPVLRFWNFFYKKRLHYAVIGGWLPAYLANKKRLLNGLKRFCGVYVETDTMKQTLEQMGLFNLFVLPNCKNLPVLSESELVYPQGLPYRLCTFSRVMKEKGIEDAVHAVAAVNAEWGYQVFSLDIYGPVEKGQEEWFNSLRKGFSEWIRYGGTVPYDKSVTVLKDYFALLFPTCYEGEGLAGTLIDAYSAGVPVIASDWKYNAEFVNENTGYLYPTGDLSAFIGILKAVAGNPTSLLSKKPLCLKEAEKYRVDTTIPVLLEQLEGV